MHTHAFMHMHAHRSIHTHTHINTHSQTHSLTHSLTHHKLPTHIPARSLLSSLFVIAAAAAKKVDVPHDELPIEENLNRLQMEGDEARTVEEAISVLGCVWLTMISAF